MIRSGTRPELKKKRIDHKKTQFATATYKEHDYPFRLSFYDVPPTAEISLEEFETWAIDRLRGLFPDSIVTSANVSTQYWPRLSRAHSEINHHKKLHNISNHFWKSIYPFRQTRLLLVVWLINDCERNVGKIITLISSCVWHSQVQRICGVDLRVWRPYCSNYDFNKMIAQNEEHLLIASAWIGKWSQMKRKENSMKN